ncbi:hypothetical protein OG21DRAFT_1420530 [Imleria badia]|nr:hypothetical protein OG21DRAFT_1420530 [Imleria badia]
MTKEAYDQVSRSIWVFLLLTSLVSKVLNAPHKAKLSHELIAAAASYEAAKAWNDHKAKNGEQVNHAKMKEFLAAAGGAFIDRMVETKGLDALEKHKAKKHGG